MKRKEIKIIVKPGNEFINLHFDKLPEQGEEIIIDYKNKYIIVRVVEIYKKKPIEILVEEQ